MVRLISEQFMAVCLMGLVLVSLAGCVTQKATPLRLKVRTLYSSAVCNSSSDRASATWLNSPEALAAAYGRLTRSRINAGPPPYVNFSDHNALLIEMGRRSTGGYLLSFAAPFVFVTDDRAQIHVNWIEPNAEAITTQLVTSPCLLLEIPKASFSSVQVVDQSHRVRAAVDIGK